MIVTDNLASTTDSVFIDFDLSTQQTHQMRRCLAFAMDDFVFVVLSVKWLARNSRCSSFKGDHISAINSGTLISDKFTFTITAAKLCYTAQM